MLEFVEMVNFKTIIIMLLVMNTYYSEVHSQDKFISGYVSDSLTGERLIGVNIYIPNSEIGTITNEFGFFSLKIPVKTREINISYVGYGLNEIFFNL